MAENLRSSFNERHVPLFARSPKLVRGDLGHIPRALPEAARMAAPTPRFVRSSLSLTRTHAGPACQRRATKRALLVF